MAGAPMSGAAISGAIPAPGSGSGGAASIEGLESVVGGSKSADFEFSGRGLKWFRCAEYMSP